MDPDKRRERLQDARLYFVCDAGFDPVELEALLGQALSGGVDIVQLRDKSATPAAMAAAASLFDAAAAEFGALFIVNDDPAFAVSCGADGVHVGQEDVGLGAARETVGEAAIIGLSTHRSGQLDAAIASEGGDRPDYVSIGPVWETPTKPGRPAAGLDYVREATRRLADTQLPWFAIGGIDPTNADQVREAGAGRFVVVRAIRDAEDPRAVAAGLRAATGAGVGAPLR